MLVPIANEIKKAITDSLDTDEFGSNLSTKEDLVNALLKLANENKSFPLSHPMYIFFYYSHPPLVERFNNKIFKQAK